MTLDEAIKQCEEIATICEEQWKEAELQLDADTYSKNKKHAEDYRQLSEWLKELMKLKQLKEQTEIVRCKDCRFSSTYVYCGELDWTCNNPEGLSRDVSEDSYCSAAIEWRADG